MRYSTTMRRNTANFKVLSSHKVIELSPRGVPFIPGIGLIILGAVIFLAPKLFLATIATFFVLLGAACCYVAWKFIAFKRHVTKLAEELHNSVEIRSFHAQNDDIDITDPESKKILFH